MLTSTRSSVLAAASAFTCLWALTATVAPAVAQTGTSTGTLTCRIAGGTSFIVGSTRSLSCVYADNNGSRERYSGTIERFGLDIGPVKSATMKWGVLALTGVSPGRGKLTGSYVGHGAQVAAGAGGGYNALYGGGNSIVLNPYSVTGVHSGANIAAGISALSLRYVGR